VPMRERSRHARYDTVASWTAPMDDRIRSAARADDASGSPGAAPPVARARFRFHGELRDLLPRAWRDAPLERDCAREATVKHAVEALGVPHTEIGQVRVDGTTITTTELVKLISQFRSNPAGVVNVDIE